MSRVAADVREVRSIPATSATLWPLVADIPSLARLIPRVERVEPVGEAWRWTMEPLSGAGYTVRPVFATSVSREEPVRVELHHVPDPGSAADASGAVVLRAADGVTRVSFHLQLVLELDLPRLLVPVVRQLLDHGLARLGKDFLHELAGAARGDRPPT